MPATAGLAPWNKNYEWELSSGWSYKKPEDWDKGIKRRKRKLHDTNGNVYDVYYYPDADYHLGYAPKNDTERLAQAELAFDPKNPIRGEVVSQECKAGHIAKLEYAQKEHILRVTFTNNGAICLFFEVPTAVAGELIYLAQTNRTRPKDGRHLVGIRFWDYIRIRGTQPGAKYPFEYESHGSGTIVQGYSRHAVKLTAENARALFGDDLKKLGKMSMLKNVDPNTEYTIVLSDEEFSKYGKALDELNVRDVSGYIESGHSDKPLVQLAEKLVDDMKSDIQAFKDSDALTLQAYEDMGLEPAKALVQALTEAADMDPTGEVARTLNNLNKRTGTVKEIQNYRQLKDFVRSRYGKGVIKSWMQEHYPAEYARRFTGRVWKVQDLIDIANYTIEGNIEPRHATVYRRLVQAKDWQGALNYLKSHKTSRTYIDPKGVERKLTSVPYAGQYDTVEGD